MLIFVTCVTQQAEIAAMHLAVGDPLPAPAIAADTAASAPVSHHDRVYAAEQFSNTVSVTEPGRPQDACLA